MKTNKIIFLGIIFIVLIVIGTIPSYAGSISISASTKTVEPGKTFKVTVTGNNATGMVTISGSNCTVSSSSVWLENNSQTITVTAGNSGTATVTAKASDVSDSNTAEEVSGSKSTSVTIKSANTNSNTNTNSNSSNNHTNTNSNNTTTTTTKKVSSDATLKNLGITPKKYDFSGFKKTKTTYNITVDNSAQNVTIYASPTSSKATVTGTGAKALKVGSNTFTIKVTAEDKKTTQTYTLNINRKEETEEIEEKEETKMALGIYKLEITGEKEDGEKVDIELNKEFERTTQDYICDVTNDIKKINVKTEAYDYNDSVKITGLDNELKEGENKITISVSDGKNTIKYNITVNKTAEETNKPVATTQETEDVKVNDKNDSLLNKIMGAKGLIIGIVVGLIVLEIVIVIAIKVLKNKNGEEE